MKTIKSIYVQTIIVVLIAGMTALPLHAEESNKSGSAAAQFLKIGVGGRAMALGGAVVASTDDPYSLYWNPAGLVKVTQPSLVAVYTDWFVDINHQFLGFVLPIDERSSFGLQATFLSMNEMEITTVAEPHGTGEYFEASDLAIGASYAVRLTDFFSLGLTGKYIEQSVYNESASTFAIDIGSTLDIPFHNMKLGMRMANFGGKMKLDGRDLTREFDLNPDNTLNVGVETRLKTEPWDLPVGVAADLIGPEGAFMPTADNRLTMSFDGVHPTDSPEYAAIGLEYSYHDIIALRGGFKSNRDVEKFFYGVGLNIPLAGSSFRFDYGLASFEELEYVHIFSGIISF